MSKLISQSARAFALACCVLTLCLPARAEDVCPDSAKPVNDPDTCKELWEKIGLPKSSDDLDSTYVCHTRYFLLHNNEAKTPYWVIEPLNKKQVSGKNTPPGTKFSAEENVCDAAQAQDGDYTKSTYDRGHQAASADFISSKDLMVESFILSNAVPQQGLGFNRGIWKQF